MIKKLILIYFLIFSNSYTQPVLKDFELIGPINKIPPSNLFGGSKNPYLYITSDLELSEVKSNLEGVLKIITKGKGIYVCEIKERAKPRITFSPKGDYKSKEYKFPEALEERQSFWFEIKSEENSSNSSKFYDYKITTVPPDAPIKIIDERNLDYNQSKVMLSIGKLPGGKQKIEIKLEDYRDTTLFITPSDKENGKDVQLTPSIGYFDFDKKSSELLSLFKPNILDSNLINIELKPSNKLKEGKYKFELNSKIIQPIEFVITNAFIKEKPLKFEDIRKIYLSILKFNISPRGAMEIKLTKDKIPFNLENSKEYLLQNGSYSVIINPENKDYKGYSGTLILENDLSDYKVNLPSDIAFIEFDEAFGNNLPTFKGINILTEKTLWQKIFGGKIYKNKTSLGLTTITYNGNNLTRDITSDYNENNPLRIFTNDFQKTGNLLLTTDIVTNFRLINTYSNIEVKQTITDDAFFTVSPGKYYLELNHSELNKSSYILDVNSEENKILFLTMKPKYSNAMYNNIYPGFGQIYKSHNTRGIIYSSIFSLSLITSYYLFSEYDSEMSNYNWTKNMYLSKVKAEEVTEWNKKLNTQFDKTNTLNNLLKLSLITVATSITFSWLDNIFWEPKFGWRDKDQTKIEVGTKEYLENFYFYIKYAFN